MSSTPQAPPPPDPARVPVSPEVQRRMDEAVARLEQLERRIAAWESRMSALEADTAAIVPVEADPRVGAIESRLARLEKRWFERRLVEARAPKPTVVEAAPAAPAAEPVAARALVYATWSSLDVLAGEPVEASVLTDGFAPEEEVVFTVGDLARPGTPYARFSRTVGPERGWVRVEFTPPAPPAGRDAQMLSMVATCGGREAHAPILTVRRKD